MAALVRSKCVLSERTEQSWGGVKLTFVTRQDDTIPESERLSKDSSSGRFDVTVRNHDPAALRFASAVLGQEFSFEIHPLPPPPVVEATVDQRLVVDDPQTEASANAVTDAPAASAPVAVAPAEAAPAPAAAPQVTAPATQTAQGTN